MFKSKKTFIVILILFPLTSFSFTLKDCEYLSTKVLKMNGADGVSCKQNKLCFAEIQCTGVTKKGKEFDVERTIVCGLDPSGNCPSVENCRADKTSASFEKEASAGAAGMGGWGAVVAGVGMDVMQYHYGRKLEQYMRDSNLRTIDDNQEPSHQNKGAQ